MHIKAKIIILNSLLVLMVTISVFLCSLYIFNSTEKKHVADLINSANNTLESTITNLERKAINETSLIAKIPELQKTIVGSDTDELKKKAKEFQESFLVNIVDFYNSSGEILLSIPASEQDSNLEKFEVPEHLVSKSLEGKIGVDYVMREGKMSMIASAPIGSPSNPSGIVITGYYVDNQVATMLKEQTQADISIFNLENQITATSLVSERKQDLIDLVVANSTKLLKSMEVRNDNYIIKPYDLLNKDDDDLGFAIIQLSLAEHKESMQTFYKFMLGSGILSLLIAAIFAVLIAAHIANPIMRLKDFTSNLIESNDLSSRAKLRGSKEVLSLQKSFNHLLDDIDTKHKKLEEYSKGLQDLVAERTNELQQEKNMISRILEHIDLGICIIDKNMRFREQYSNFFASFYKKSMAEIKACGRPLELLLPQIEKGVDLINRQHEAIFASLGESSFTWDLNCEHLINEAIIQPDGTRKIIQIWWTPIVENEITSEIMITIKDVTDQKQLEEQVAKQKQETSKKIEIITQLLSKDKLFINLFFQDSFTRINEIIEHLKQEQTNPELIFVNLHTIKGSSRSQGFKAISDQAHNAEEIVQDLRAGKSINLEDLKKRVEDVKKELDFYQRTFTGVVGGEANNVESLSIHSVLGQHLAAIKANLAKAQHGIDEISINDRVLYWNEENFQHIVGIFVHGVNNAIDHGYLRPKKKGTEVDPIKLSLSASKYDENNIVLELRDYGLGINFEKIREILRDTNTAKDVDSLSKEELGEYLFKDGISTSDDISETSGRGSGLSAIKSIADDLKGKVKLEEQEKGTKLVAIIPKELVIGS